VFGDEKHNYDEAKRFCFTNRNENCSFYSIGSNNKWHFEETIYAATNCTMDTFDCTVDGNVPTAINDRTKFHKHCLSPFSFRDKSGFHYNTLDELNKLTNRVDGPDYLKIDVEVLIFFVCLKTLFLKSH
jgi:hypothetical protein